MTECENAEIRDVLPDFVAETLSAADMSRISAHLTACRACVDEVALIRVARAARPQAVHLDVDAIVARLTKSARPVVGSAPVSTSHLANRIEGTQPDKRTVRAQWSVWQVAAAVGVIAVGGMSVAVARSGSVGLARVAGIDSAQLSDVAGGESASARFSALLDSGQKAPPVGVSSTMLPMATTTVPRVTDPRQTVVSVGDLSDYTDAELQRMLDRVDKWDGATSGEVMPTMPLVPVAVATSTTAGTRK